MTTPEKGVKFLISRIPLIFVTRLGWRYRQKISSEAKSQRDYSTTKDVEIRKCCACPWASYLKKDTCLDKILLFLLSANLLDWKVCRHFFSHIRCLYPLELLGRFFVTRALQSYFIIIKYTFFVCPLSWLKPNLYVQGC